MRDLRNKAQLESARSIEQRRLDNALEAKWRANVAANVRRRLEQRVAQFLSQETK